MLNREDFCACCNEFFGKERKVVNRFARKRLKNELNKELKYEENKISI